MAVKTTAGQGVVRRQSCSQLQVWTPSEQAGARGAEHERKHPVPALAAGLTPVGFSDHTGKHGDTFSTLRGTTAGNVTTQMVGNCAVEGNVRGAMHGMENNCVV